MKIKTLTIFTILSFLIASCSGSSNAADTSSSTANQVEAAESTGEEAIAAEPQADEQDAPAPGVEGNPGTGPMDGEGRVISDQEKLIIGIFELEDSDLAVTTEQASSLIQLWTSMLELTQREPQEPGAEPTDAEQPAEPQNQSEEITAIFEEIQSVMSDEQLAVISALELDQDTITAFMEEQGIEMGSGMQPGQGEAGEGQTPPEGGQPAESEGGPGGKDPEGEIPADGDGQMQAEERMGGGRGGFQMVSSELIRALIELLESKVS